VEKDVVFIEFCKRVRLDPNITKIMKTFVKLKYFDELPKQFISSCMGLSLDELKEIEEELMRHQRSNSILQ